MLRLTKQVSAENYPLTPQSSSVRKLTLKVTPAQAVSLAKSYLLVKNTLTTTIRGAQVARNVGWGSQFAADLTAQYPATCQIRNCALSVDGELLEYNEDLNVRLVNMEGYMNSPDQMKKWSNVGGWGFQRVEGGLIGALDGTTAGPQSDGTYLSPFLERVIGAGGAMTAAATYKEVPSVIYLSDIFQLCKSVDVAALAGREVKIELQFEDYYDISAEHLNYATDHSVTPLAKTTSEVFQVDPATLVDPATGALPLVAATTFRVASVQKFACVADCPFYVGQTLCVWNSAGAEAVGDEGSNFATITALRIGTAGTAIEPVGALMITFQQYQVGGNAVKIGAAGAAAACTAAEFFANIVNGTPASIIQSISAAFDPIPDAAANNPDKFQFPAVSAGQFTKYNITGLEVVMCETSAAAAKQTVTYVQYLRDLDNIAGGQLSYQKSFQLDPNTAAVFAIVPCVKATGGAQNNMFALSEFGTISQGFAMRNMMNGVQLYNRDITWGQLKDAVSPLQFDRMEMAFSSINASFLNYAPTSTLIRFDGTAQNCLIAERVPVSGNPQQLQLRLKWAANSDPRTVFVFKAVLRQISL